MQTYPPIDFSFKNLKSMRDLLNEEARGGVSKQIQREIQLENDEKASTKNSARTYNGHCTDRTQKKRSYAGHTDSIHQEQQQQQQQQQSTVECTVYMGPSLKLACNQLSDLSSFAEVVEQIHDSPSSISWLDLSMNNITALNEDIFKLDLRTLYLHGNGISELKEIEKLRQFTNLKTLTLHGNPIDQMRNYRYMVISLLPSLKVLDFTTITRRDLETAETFKKLFGRSIAKKRSATGSSLDDSTSSSGSRRERSKTLSPPASRNK